MRLLLLFLFVLSLRAEVFYVDEAVAFQKALHQAQANNQSDTIILAKGSYSSMDAPFTFDSNESYDLTITSNTLPSEVILTGMHQERILKIIAQGVVRLESLSLVGGQTTSQNGAGLFHQGPLLILKDLIVRENVVNNALGGGVYTTGSALVVNTLFIFNKAIGYGANASALKVGKTLEIINTTVTANQLSVPMVSEWLSNVLAYRARVFNCLFFDNFRNEWAADIEALSSSSILNAHINAIGSPEEFVIDGNFYHNEAIFFDSAFHLLPNSTIIDKGIAMPKEYSVLFQTYIGDALQYDLHHNPRVRGKSIDLGAVEYQEPLEWEVIESVDFNQDGIRDIWWRNRLSGVLVVWLMRSDWTHQLLWLGRVEPSWRVALIGDINGDGVVDIFWRKEALVYLWQMQKDGSYEGGYLKNLDTSWQIHSLVNQAIFLRHASGANALWLFDEALNISFQEVNHVN